MKIYTRKGDDGSTSLLGGSRISKADQRIMAYGTVDELNSYLGLLRDQPENKERANFLIEIQNTLFTIGSRLALEDPESGVKLPDISGDDISNLEQAIDQMDANLPPMKHFILPGGHQAVSVSHVCRTICRRTEREVIALSGTINLDPIIIQYLNRLSDYLFVLCRVIAQETGAQEIPWKPQKD